MKIIIDLKIKKQLIDLQLVAFLFSLQLKRREIIKN